MWPAPSSLVIDHRLRPQTFDLLRYSVARLDFGECAAPNDGNGGRTTYFKRSQIRR